MPFAVEHTIDLATLDVPEPSPNDASPLATRTFPSPTLARGGAHALVGWADNGGPIGFDAWYLAGDTWVFAGRREAADEAATPGIVLPPDAMIFVRIRVGTPPDYLRLAFRSPEAGDVDAAAPVDVGDLPEAILPGSGDPNAPTTYVISRVQAYDRFTSTWSNICAVNLGSPVVANNTCAQVVYVGNFTPIPITVADSAGLELVSLGTPGMGDPGVTVRTASEGDIAASRTSLDSLDAKLVTAGGFVGVTVQGVLPLPVGATSVPIETDPAATLLVIEAV